MNLSFTGKLVLERIEEKDSVKIITLSSYLKEDFVEKSLIIYLRGEKVSQLRFSSNKYGNALWTPEQGVFNVHKWETEEDIKQISNLTKHYPALFENGLETDEFAYKYIIPDIIDSLLTQEMRGFIITCIYETQPVEEIISNYKIKSNDYIQNELPALQEFQNAQAIHSLALTDWEEVTEQCKREVLGPRPQETKVLKKKQDVNKSKTSTAAKHSIVNEMKNLLEFFTTSPRKIFETIKPAQQGKPVKKKNDAGAYLKKAKTASNKIKRRK